MVKKFSVGKRGGKLRFPSLHSSADSGYAVAEFAMVFPALVMVLFFGFWIVQVGLNEYSLQTEVTQIARAIARGDNSAPQIAEAAIHGVTFDITTQNNVTSVVGKRSIHCPAPLRGQSFELKAVAAAQNEGATSD